MIRLHKAEEPESLKEGAADWTAEFLDAIADGTDPSAVWSNRINAQIKLALIAETSGKCAYCESKILHDQYGDIEHFFPKSLDPFRAFEWGNLTFACKICNTRKAARDPHAANIIDPYDVNPENYLIFLGPLVTDNGSDLGSGPIKGIPIGAAI